MAVPWIHCVPIFRGAAIEEIDFVMHPDDIIATFQSRQGGGSGECSFYRDRVVVKFSTPASDRSQVSGEQTYSLTDLRPTSMTGTIKERRSMVILMTIMIAVGGVMGTQNIQERPDLSPAGYNAFAAIMLLLVIAIVLAVVFAWKTMRFRTYTYQSGAVAFSVLQGNRSQDQFEHFCDQLESAILAAQ